MSEPDSESIELCDVIDEEAVYGYVYGFGGYVYDRLALSVGSEEMLVLCCAWRDAEVSCD